jgi:hypothetical protein
VLFVGLLAAGMPAAAQDVPLSQLLVNLIQSDVRLAPPPPGFQSHEAHFLPGANQTLAPYLFNQELVAQLATFPIGSPTGGFAFMFDANTGTFERSTATFGPSFADRALTNGRGRLTVGTNFQYSKYSTFNGDKLDNGDVKFYLTHQPIPGDPFFEGDLVQAALNLNLSSATTAVFANFGVTNALDVAVAVPIVHVSMDARVDATVLRLATEGLAIHAFPGGSTTASFSSSGRATGVGDILVRGKYRFFSGAGGGLAAAVDLRLPTGDADNLLGTGATAATFTFIGSGTSGRFAPHINIGYTATGTSDVVNLANEFVYKFGTEIEASPRVTINADLLGRSLLDVGRLELASTTHTFMNQAGVPGSQTFEEYVARSGSLNVTDFAIGGKFNVGSNLLLNANVLIAVNDAGVRSRVTPVVGFDYTF